MEERSSSFGRWFNFDGARQVWMVVSDTYEWDGDGPTTQPVEITEWFHTDQVGSTRAMTGQPEGEPPAAGVVRRKVYTAFGEDVTPTVAVLPGGNRYGYGGAWGYESDWAGDLHAASLWGAGFDSPGNEFGGDAAGLVHVGARWYEPATGRFIQRDPIGIQGGLNVYAYVSGIPLTSIDPEGLDRYIVRDSEDYGAHAGIVVDDGRGGYIRLDFSAKTWTNNGRGAGFKAFFGDQGLVQIRHYRTADGALGCYFTRISSTTEQDAKLVSWMLDKHLSPPRYGILGGETCISIANEGSFVGIPQNHTYQDKIFHFP